MLFPPLLFLSLLDLLLFSLSFIVISYLEGICIKRQDESLRCFQKVHLKSQLETLAVEFWLQTRKNIIHLEDIEL